MAKKKLCPECKKQVSPKATKCPNCGHPLKNKMGCGGFLVILLVIAVFGYMIEQCSNSDVDTIPDTTPQKSEKLIKLEKKLGEKPKKSVFDGSVRVVENYVKTIAKDPSNIKFQSWSDISYNEKDG